MPRRETQIFSLSMMDVISGAMGAFLIIMVVLMRYYKEDKQVAQQREQVQAQLEKVRRQIDEAIKQLQATTDVDVAELLRRLMALKQEVAELQKQVQRLSNDLQAARNRVNQLQAQVSELQSQVAGLRSENNQLRQEKQNLEQEIKFKRPFVVVADWVAQDRVDVDLVIATNLHYSGPHKELLFDPDEKIDWTPPYQSGVDTAGPSGPEYMLVSQSFAGAEYKIYVVLRKGDAIVPTKVDVAIVGPGIGQSLGSVELSRNNPWQLMAILVTGDDGVTHVRTATDADRSADRREVELRMRKKARDKQPNRHKKPTTSKPASGSPGAGTSTGRTPGGRTP